MSIKLRLITLSFLQFFVWGAWLISLGGYLGSKLGFNGGQIGAIFATLGIASMIMPGILGVIADKWVNAEYLLGICHLLGAACLYYASTTTDYHQVYVAMLLNVLCYMPTISLNYSVSYHILHRYQYNVVKTFPPIRTFGTIGFICAMWIVDITAFKNSSLQLVFASISSIVLGIYAFTLPKCPPAINTQKSMLASFGLDALVLFKQKRMAVFFFFSILLGATLQITNTYGSLFIESFNTIPEYAHSLAVRHSIILLSISQISEALFILAIPFFLSRFGIKAVILMSMFAWVLRFGLFGLGNPGDGLWILILSMIVYGMAFDFFNISGSLFVEKETPSSIKAGAQGLFLMMTNGIGAAMGGYASGAVVNFFSISENGILLSRNWQAIWFIFAIYAFVIAILFAFCFRTPKKIFKQ